jgi:hypothetical protein
VTTARRRDADDDDDDTNMCDADTDAMLLALRATRVINDDYVRVPTTSPDLNQSIVDMHLRFAANADAEEMRAYGEAMAAKTNDPAPSLPVARMVVFNFATWQRDGHFVISVTDAKGLSTFMQGLAKEKLHVRRGAGRAGEGA